MFLGRVNVGRLPPVVAVATRPAPPAAGHAAVRRPPALRVVLAGLAIFLLALAPRLIGLEQHLTADDQDWVRRTVRFSQALQRGNWRDTYQSGHPGVTVLGLAALTTGPQRTAELAPRLGDLVQLEKSPAYLGVVYDARRALAILTAALTVLLAALVWRLFGAGVGLLAGLLLAGEPFLVAHDRLFHTDPLLAKLMAISVLAALIFFERRGGRAFLVGSGLAAGLACITKAPAIFLFGFVPLLSLAWSWRRSRSFEAPELRRLVVHLAIWGLAAAAIAVLLWPALWADALGTLGRLYATVRGVGESPRRWGNFFLGQAYPDDVPKPLWPLFYPVVTLFRLSPITLAGLLLVGWLGLRGKRPARWPPAVALLAGALLFAALLTLSPKKLDRYALPIYPPLVILAALGLRWALRGWRPAGRRLATLALALGQAALVAAVQPYPLSFYNPALGGIGAARQVMIIGWGEGTDQVAAYLDRQPNAAEIVVVSLYNDLITPKFAGLGVPPWEWQRADYLADYVNMDQRNLLPAPLQALVRDQTPVFRARVNDLDYVRLYRIPPELRADPSRGPTGTSVPHP